MTHHLGFNLRCGDGGEWVGGVAVAVARVSGMGMARAGRSGGVRRRGRGTGVARAES